jgi:ribonuclease III
LPADLNRRRALRAFGRRLGLKGAVRGDCGALDAALTHDSYANERARPGDAPATSNERLEFLGDAVLGHIVAHALFERFRGEREGVLSRRRAALVSRDALASTARRLDVAPLVLLGKGEAAAGGERRPSILAAVFEALVGAIYLSEGFDAARRFVEREHLAHASEPSAADPKTALQEYAQARFKRPPTYAVTGESGPAHAKTFTISVSVGGNVMGTGSGPTKKQAQAEAALEALNALTAKSRQRRGSELST